MLSLYKVLIQWSEVWPLLIPLTIFLVYGLRYKELNILVFYALIAFLLNLLATIIWLYPKTLPGNFTNNNILYNINSLIRTILPGIYLLSLKQMRPYKYLKIILILYVFLVVINFCFFDNIFILSSRLFAAESIVLLIFSLTFLLNLIIEEDIPIKKTRTPLLICAGIGIYESINFFIYLFFYHALDENFAFAFKIFNISKYSFIVYWILLGMAFYYSRRNLRPLKAIKSSY
jgi:hypothetical protein